MFLPLAERMVEKMVKEEKIEAEAEVSVPPPPWPRPVSHPAVLGDAGGSETNSGLFKVDQTVDSCRSQVDIWAESALSV